VPGQAGLDFGPHWQASVARGPGRLSAWDPEGWEMDAGWRPVVDDFLHSPTGVTLASFLAGRLAHGALVYPPEPLRALALTPLRDVRVVILGQDPYHGPGQAEGLAFSVAPGLRLPPSLRNIFKELQRAPGCAPPASGSLVGWARRGVLLLNTCLTVEDGLPASHAGKGWEALTDALIAHVAASAPACVYLLWGAHAQAKAPLIARASAEAGRDSLVLQANHPSPLSAMRPPIPFLGCGHFGQSKAWLAERGIAFDWCLD
jgi:uracil-DNA glycosylase